MRPILSILTVIACLISWVTFIEAQQEPTISFSNLNDAITFIVQAVEEDDYKKLSNACIKKMAFSQDEEIFGILKGLNQRMPIVDLYSGNEFPKDKNTFRLGGHGEQWGYIHIIFIKKNDKWYLSDILSCN